MAKKKHETPTEEIVQSIKGFDKNLKCRDFQFELGKTYEHDGPVKACSSGFHAIEGHPLEVFDYYPASESRYAETKQSGTIARHSGDSKVASAKITIGVELHLHDLIQRAVKWVFDHAKPEGDGSHATGTRGAASATGTRGKVMGKTGNALFLVYRDDSYNIIHAWAGIVGQNGIKEGVWYSLNPDGTPEEVK